MNGSTVMALIIAAPATLVAGWFARGLLGTIADRIVDGPRFFISFVIQTQGDAKPIYGNGVYFARVHSFRGLIRLERRMGDDLRVAADRITVLSMRRVSL